MTRRPLLTPDRPAAVVTRGCLKFMAQLADDAVDLGVASPPYETQRTYRRGYRLERMGWLAEWAPVFHEQLRVTRGPVCWVIANTHRGGRESLIVERLKVALDDAGVYVHPNYLYERYSTPGKRRYARDILETVVVASKSWPLPYLDEKAAGGPPKHRRGGDFSHRTAAGGRVAGKPYPAVERCMAVNVIRGPVGGGHMAATPEQSRLAEQGQAPYPEWLVAPLIETFCPPGGVVLDPLCGTGTTLTAARRLGRRAVGCDRDKTQTAIARRRLELLAREMAAGTAEGVAR
ncbi:MAG: site-specific DNA-methyltransferase [Planctomycetota bacterium]